MNLKSQIRIVTNAVPYIEKVAVALDRVDWEGVGMHIILFFEFGNKMAAKGKVLCHVEKNLKALGTFPRVALNNIKDFPEAFKPVRVGPIV